MGQGGFLGRARCVASVIIGCLALVACAGPGPSSRIDPKYGVASSPRVIEPGQQVPRGGGAYRIGTPYVIGGRTYVPQEDPHYRAEGVASWYGHDFHGRRTANGEVYDMHSLSAAHPTLPMPSYVRVTNLANRRSIILRVNDRGPYHGNRVIDVSGKAAEMLAFRQYGVARVRVEFVGLAPLEGSDDRQLLATLREGSPAPAPSMVRVASARPVLSDTAGRAIAGPVPVPQERPFDLGPGAAAREASWRANVIAQRDPRRGVEADDGMPRTSFAPLGPATGRGLY